MANTLYRIAQIDKQDGTSFYQLQTQKYGKGEWISLYANASLDNVRSVRDERKSKDDEFMNRNVTIIE